jgi:hypothetical protein
VCNLLLVCEPLAGWRQVMVSDRRTRSTGSPPKMLASSSSTSAPQLRADELLVDLFGAEPGWHL